MTDQLRIKNVNMVRPKNIKVLVAWVKKNGAWNNSHASYTCKTCKKTFFKPPSAKSIFCSKQCLYENMRKEKGVHSRNWKGGKSSNNKCVDCQKRISFAAQRCKSCAAKLMPHTSMKQKPWLRTPEATKKALRRHPISSLEDKFQKIIDKHKLPYKYVGNGKFLIERKNPDFININGEKKAVEVYARRHKEKLRNTTIDEWKKNRKEVFARYGWNIIFFDETQLNDEMNVLFILKGGVSHS